MSLAVTAEARTPAHERLVLAFGDSLTAGYGLRPSESFPARLEARLRAEGVQVRVHNAGISGDTTAGGRARLVKTLERLGRQPDLVIVELGGNDLLLGQPVTAVEANLDAILAELHRRGIPVVLAGLYDPQPVGVVYFDRFNGIYPRLAHKYGATLHPFFMKGVVSNSPLLLGDGLHPNARGVEVITGNILPVIRNELRRPPNGR